MDTKTFYRLKILKVGDIVDDVYVDHTRARYSGKDFRPFAVRSDGSAFCRMWWSPNMIEGPSKHPLNFFGVTAKVRRLYVQKFYPHLYNHKYPGIHLTVAKGYHWRVHILVASLKVQLLHTKYFEEALLVQYTALLLIGKHHKVKIDIFDELINAFEKRCDEDLTWPEYRVKYGSPIPKMVNYEFPLGDGGII